MTSHHWTRVKDVAIQAWERPEAERAEYVARACMGDDGLEREVLSLVASMVEAEGRFEDPLDVSADCDQLVSLAGRRVGAYEVLTRVGAGGMGDVYKARDTRLDRIVALKVLSAAASTDPVSRDRMAREARAIAALNHPHICSIYDIGSHDGVDYLVMEFVDGETLATRLSRGELSVAEALRYAEQIAAALGEAHRAGIVHRDVKPANIMLQAAADSRTQAKLLDFGVAKASGPDTTPALKPLQPETAADLTIAGFIVGTPYYMAPEQLDRNATDPRTDIFAFGAVLFEMLTARKAFEGTNRDEVLGAIRAGRATLPSSAQPRIPAVLDRIVVRCLATDPSDRYQTADELLVDLRAAQRRLDASRRRRLIAASLVGLLLACGGVVAWAISVRGTAAEPGIDPSLTRLPASAGVIGGPALSPDGSRLAFLWVGDGIDNPELMLLAVGSTARTRLTNDPGVEEWPAWSPNGREIVFIRCGSATCGIFALGIAEGVERKLRDLRFDRYFGLAWSPDGSSVIYGERSSSAEPYSLFELSLRDSSIRRLTRSSGLGDLRFAFSPDGRTLAFIRVGQRTIAVHLLPLESREETILLDGQAEWFGGITWSSDGRSLILAANQRGVRRLWRLPVKGGRLEPLAIAGEDTYYPAVQGSRLVFVRSFQDFDFMRMTLSGGKLQLAAPFPSSTRLDIDPAFSPNGDKLAFVSERGGTREVWVSDADGSRATQVTSLGGPPSGHPSWSPDGRQLAFHGGGINVVPVQGGPTRRVCDDGERPTWSADGNWIYFSRGPGKLTLWRVPVVGGTPEQVLTSEVLFAREGPHGRELYFAGADGIWRRSVDRSEAQRIIPDFTWSLPGYWTVVSDGIYYVVRTSLPDGHLVHQLKFYDFAGGQTTGLGMLSGSLEDWVGGLTVSSDRRTVVYSQRTYQSNEIMLVEHFR